MDQKFFLKGHVLYEAICWYLGVPGWMTSISYVDMFWGSAKCLVLM